MAKTPTSKDDFQFDVRILAHRLRRGQLTQAEIDAHKASLPDEADEAVESQIRFTTPYADRARGEAGKG
jgi:hypothetical protein